MVRQSGSARPAEFPAAWARWLALGVFAALVAIGLLPLRPNPAAAIAAAAVAIAAAALENTKLTLGRVNAPVAARSFPASPPPVMWVKPLTTSA